MLARLDQAISEFRYAAVPLDKDDVAEAIAFLEWLRDDNFTFLGMREFNYTGGEKSGTLERADKPGLGILTDPDVLVLRRGTEAVTTTPEIRAFLHGPDAADRHQGQRQVGRCTAASISTTSASRPMTAKGALVGRAAHRRPVHLDRLHALGDEDPLSALEGARPSSPNPASTRPTIPARR